MAKMEEESLLNLLQAFEDDAGQFVTGPLRTARDRNVKDYFRRPYGNEEPGWSGYVSSDTMDTIEWMLPDLLDIFVSNPKAVEFEPTRESEVEGAKQATQGCNYVFYQQNPGFHILQTAFRDALLVKNCAITWRAEDRRSVTNIPAEGVTMLELAALVDEEAGDEIVELELAGMRPLPPPMMMLGGAMVPIPGMPTEEPVYNAKVRKVETRRVCKVEAFEPENLGIYREWTSPYLEECPYVVRWQEVTLSELNQLADQLDFKRVKAEDLAGSHAIPQTNPDDSEARRNRTGDSSLGAARRPEGIEAEDESQTLGWIRYEWVLADVDGDGIAERRYIIRLDDQILYNVECSHVPMCTGSPIPIAHRWDGLSIADLLSDLQMMHTDLMRGVINNAYSSNNPRKIVAADRKSGAPKADIDDLLDSRPGGFIREWEPNAVRMEPTAYVGNQFEPLLQRVDMLREKRTGMTMTRMALDPNAIRKDQTLGEVQIADTAAKQRIKLIARNFAETIVMPMMRGILKTLTEGGFEPLFFKLRGTDRFVQLDPNEWRDSYNMVPNVGLGTGDDQQKLMTLRSVAQDQIMLAQSPLGPKMVSPKAIYNTRVQMLELSGIRNIGDYYTDPGNAPLPEAPKGPPPEVIIEQMRLEAARERLQAEKAFELEKLDLQAASERQRQRDQNEVQQANDQRDAERQALEAYYNDRIKALELQLDKYKTDQDNLFKVIVAKITHPEGELPEGFNLDPETGMAAQGPDRIDAVLDQLAQIAAVQQAPREVVRDANGTPTHIRQGGIDRPIVYGPDGAIIGVQ